MLIKYNSLNFNLFDAISNEMHSLSLNFNSCDAISNEMHSLSLKDIQIIINEKNLIFNNINMTRMLIKTYFLN